MVIFLLDASSPIKRTEKEFLEEHILRIGLDKVLFIANRFDEIEEEDEEEALTDIKKRLAAALKGMELDEIHVIPFSAFFALKGVIQQDQHLTDQSNLPFVKDKILSLIYDGISPENKLNSYTRRLALGIESLDREIQQELEINAASIEQLEGIIENMSSFKTQEENRIHKLYEYAEYQEKDMLAIIRKSLQYFQGQLKEEILDSVDSYKGTEFKNYIEKQIVSLVQKRISQWVSTYSYSMNQMLSKLNKEIAEGLARHFNTSISVSSSPLVSTEFNKSPMRIQIEADDISNVTTKAGLIVGGTAGILALVGGPLLLPIVGLAGFPFLQKTMLDQKLKEAKDKIIPEDHHLENEQ